MVMRGTRDAERGSGVVRYLVLVALFIGYMVYTGTYNPLVAAQNLINTVLGILPVEVGGVQGFIDMILDLFYRLVAELRNLL